MKFGEKAAKETIREANLLEDNEKIMWARTPQEKAYKFVTKIYALSIFLSIWLTLSIFNLGLTKMTHHLMWQGIVLAVALVSTGITVYLRKSKNRKEAYALTNQRVIHYFQSALGFKQNVDDLYHEQIVDVDMTKTGVPAKMFDVGNVLFSRRGSQSATSGGGTGSAVAFKLISDPKNTHHSLRRTIIKEVGGGALTMKDIDSYREGRSLDEASAKKRSAGPGGKDIQEVNKQLSEIKEILKSIDRKL